MTTTEAWPIEAEWTSDGENGVRLTAVHVQSFRASKQFKRARRRQLIWVFLMMMGTACFVSLLIAGADAFLAAFVPAGAATVLWVGYLAARSGSVSDARALRLARGLARAGTFGDTSGRWRFRWDGEHAEWFWAERGMTHRVAADRLDPPRSFDGTVLFTANAEPVGLVPFDAITPAQRAVLLAHTPQHPTTNAGLPTP